MSGMEQPHTSKRTDQPPATSTDDTIANLSATSDTSIGDSGLGSTDMPDASRKAGRFEERNLRVTIVDRSLRIVLGKRASSFTKKLVQEFKADPSQNLIKANLQVHGQALRLRVMNDTLHGERETPKDQPLIGVATFRRVKNEVFIDTLQDTNGKEVSPFRITRNVILAERAVARKMNDARENTVHQAKFKFGVVEGRSSMPGNDSMQEPVRQKLVDIDSALTALLKSEQNHQTEKTGNSWLDSLQAVKEELETSIHTACPTVDALLLVFSAKEENETLASLKQDPDLHDFLAKVRNVKFLDRSKEAGLKRKILPLVQNLGS